MTEDFGSSEAGKKGGKARAENLSKERKSEIARKAALSRWSGGGTLPVATHGDAEHPLKIGGLEIGCYVLDNEKRVVSQRGLQSGIGMHVSGGAQRFLKILDTFSSKDVDCKDLAARIQAPIRFVTSNGSIAHGYEATVLADICEVFLAARTANALQKQQMHIAKQCEILIRGFARVGIIALVDEATGFQRDRVRDALAKILEAYVAKELQPWLKTFELEFYELMCELRGEPLERAKKRPAYFGKLTDNLVYMRLPYGVREKLRELNPVQENSRRKRKLFQHLTDDFGYPKLKEHLAGVTSVMKMAKIQGTPWPQFMKILDKTHPKARDMPLFKDLKD